MSDPELRDLRHIAEIAAREAGRTLKAHRADWSGIEAEIGREVKVDADRRAEALILDRLSRESAFPILSEETGWSEGGAGEVFWAVDPLDGSVNYIQGFPHCGVSIALMRGGAPVLGVVDLFLLEEFFSGQIGEGATLNGRPIRVSRVTDPARGILNTGIPSRMSDDDATRDAFLKRLLKWRKVRMIGCASAALAYVAAGRADAYRESGAMLWDVAAGCALVAASGGNVHIGGLEGPLEVAGTNGVIPQAD